ncbi:kinase-like domain-containing protein [Ochromonadaceae sp. CCMP2298]|nr:kinase-like domain-containing protein [Ochromonadaceae sp. CCMP2298]|mmetsp:Transcript_12489/g.27759  ORF Transcript_12489/g.27759 Transcript_12489/m.27759 type:complete len:432 (-) Transcript_12489:182-1477(-)
MGASPSSVKGPSRDAPSFAPLALEIDKIHCSCAEDSDTGSSGKSKRVVYASNYDSAASFTMLKDLMEKYECGKGLGKGASGEVFEVTQKATGKKFACKTVHKTNAMSDTETMFVESEILKRLRHENIAALEEIFGSCESRWYILELANGGLLHSALASAPTYTEGLVASAFAQLLLGVSFLHSVGVVHRDIKAENVLCNVSDTGEITVKLADFGLAAVLSDKKRKTTSNVNKMKAFKGLKERCGTNGYIAPEVFSQAYGPQVDVWGLGCVLFELLTGEVPFKHKEIVPTVFDKIMSLTARSAPFDRAYKRSAGWQLLSDGARDLINQMLKVNPRHRLSVDECLRHPWVTGTIDQQPVYQAYGGRQQILRNLDLPAARLMGRKLLVRKQTRQEELDQQVIKRTLERANRSRASDTPSTHTPQTVNTVSALMR